MEGAESESSPAEEVPLTEMSIYDAEGEPFSLRRLGGEHAVLVFGCPTCPPFLAKLPALEAVYRDYSAKGVKFYVVFSGLMHPEYQTYLTPCSLRDRSALVAKARRQLGSTIPWLLDTPDGDLKRRFGAIARAKVSPEGEVIMPNGQIVLDPEGNVAHLRIWSDPDELRAELGRLVGPADESGPAGGQAPTVESVAVLPGGTVEGDLTELPPNEVPVEPLEPGPKDPYFAKLQVRVGDRFHSTGAGKACFVLRLDPVYAMTWDRGSPPIVEIDDSRVSGVDVGAKSLAFEPSGAAILTRVSDIEVDFLRPRPPVTVTVRYAVCDRDGGPCRNMAQSYAVSF